MTTPSLYEALDTGVAKWDLRVTHLSDYRVTVFQDRFPVTHGHLLFVPEQNTDDLITEAFKDALREGRRMVADGECNAFNIGINMGEAAGQTVMYPHVHLIPRRDGDSPDPVGGVRGVIPGQANYRSSSYQKAHHD